MLSISDVINKEGINNFHNLGCKITHNKCIVNHEVDAFFEENLKMIGNANIIVWNTYVVQTGNYKNNLLRLSSGEKKIEWEHLVELRVFNKEAELRMIKVKDGFISRLIQNDYASNEQEGYIQLHSLYGSEIEERVGNTIIREESRGIEFTLPFGCNKASYKQLIGGRLQKKDFCNVFAGSITYVEYDEEGKLYTKDSRLIGYYKIDEKNSIMEVF